MNGTAPRRHPRARGFVVQVHRAAGVRYMARVVERGRVRDVAGDARATQSEAERALELELAGVLRD